MFTVLRVMDHFVIPNDKNLIPIKVCIHGILPTILGSSGTLLGTALIQPVCWYYGLISILVCLFLSTEKIPHFCLYDTHIVIISIELLL